MMVGAAGLCVLNCFPLMGDRFNYDKEKVANPALKNPLYEIDIACRWWLIGLAIFVFGLIWHLRTKTND